MATDASKVMIVHNTFKHAQTGQYKESRVFSNKPWMRLHIPGNGGRYNHRNLAIGDNQNPTHGKQNTGVSHHSRV